MKIIGNGMIARSFLNIAFSFNCHAYIFASGVSNSLCDLQSEFDRELFLLKKTLLECEKESATIVYFSSAGAVYQKSDDIKSENYPTLPQTHYGQHKLLCESIIRDSGVPHLIARLPNVVGQTKNNRQLVPYLTYCAKKGYVEILRDARRDLIDVDDVVKIVSEILKTRPIKLTLNVASGYSIPVIDIFNEIQHAMRLSPKVSIIKGGDAQIFNISLMEKTLFKRSLFDITYYKKIIAKYCNS